MKNAGAAQWGEPNDHYHHCEENDAATQRGVHDDHLGNGIQQVNDDAVQKGNGDDDQPPEMADEVMWSMATGKI